MDKQVVNIFFGSHSSVNVAFEDHDIESKVTIEPTNKYGSHLVIIADNKSEFIDDLQKLLMKYYI